MRHSTTSKARPSSTRHQRRRSVAWRRQYMYVLRSTITYERNVDVCLANAPPLPVTKQAHHH